MKYRTLLRKVFETFPKFVNFIGKDFDDYIFEQKVLITIVFSDLAKYFVYLQSHNDKEEINRINSFLDSLIGDGDEDIQNIIITGFLESFDPSHDSYSSSRKLLSRRLSKALGYLDDVLALKRDAPSNWFE